MSSRTAKPGSDGPRVRSEDDALVRGQGVFSDDLDIPGAAFGVVLRSPYAAATIRVIETSRAEGTADLIGICTGADLRADGIGPLPFMSLIEAPGGGPPRCQGLPVLAVDEVRYVGQPVAFVVARTAAAARDCAELIEIEYEERPHVIELAAAAAVGAAQVDAAVAGNVVAEYRLGDEAACRAALAASAHRVSLAVTNNRLIACPMEPRAVVGVYDESLSTWTLHCGNQGPHHSRAMLAEGVFGVALEQIRIRVPRIGGAFGSKLTPYAEDALVLYAARRFSIPVRWRADRSEAFLADYHARDHQARVILGFDSDLRITALSIEDLANLGAYPTPFGIPIATTTGNRVVNGVYDIPVVHLSVKTVLSNTVPTAPYRGAGRPEVVHRLECAFEAAAAELGVDPVELRRRNFIQPESIPAPVHAGLTYDSGDFPAILDRALLAADWDGFAARQRESATRGLTRGRGIACHIDSTSGISPSEIVNASVDAAGRCEFLSGTQEMGQGLHSTYLDIAAGVLELPRGRIDVVQGDTERVTSGVGSYGSRSLFIGGAAIEAAARALIEQACRLGARLLEAETHEVGYAAGFVTTVDGTRKVDLAAIAGAQLDAAFRAEGKAEAPFCFPNGCYVCEVEIDRATGRLRIERFTGVDDVGRVFNPVVVHGQMHGSLAQGIGQALFEQVCYDAESGQLVTGSLLDYTLPRADDLPRFEGHLDESQPATTNTLGAKGAGECGTVGGPPAVVAAIANALPECRIEELEMPLTAEKIWRLLNAQC